MTAARALLESVDPKRVRVGLLTFSGQVDLETGRQIRRNQQDAKLEVPLTQDYDRVRRALDERRRARAARRHNFAAGIRLATQELAGLSGAVSSARPDAKKVILFLTDGTPTLPSGPGHRLGSGGSRGGRECRPGRSGRRYSHQHLRPRHQALTRPMAATEIARVTLGTFTPVLEPGAIVTPLQGVSFANIEDVGVTEPHHRRVRHRRAPQSRRQLRGLRSRAGGTEPRARQRSWPRTAASANLELDFEFRVKDTDDRMKERELARLRKLNDELLRHVEAERIRRERRRERMQREIEIRAVRPEDEE